MTRRYASAGAVVTTVDLTNTAGPRTLLLDQTRAIGERQTVAPKGRIEPGEGPLAAAVREVAEEAGLTDLSYAGYLGREGYAFTDNDGTPAAKTVDWFLLTTSVLGAEARAAEGFTGVRWLTFDDAVQAASHPGFVTFLRRAADVVAWRRGGPLPFSATLDRVVREIADAAQPLLTGKPGAGLAVCGSAARGDFVGGWSDIDLIAYGPHSHDALTELVRDTTGRHDVRVSLRLADANGQPVSGEGPLHAMKLTAALRRVGADVAVIAGTPLTSVPPAPNPAEIVAGLTALGDFATDHLAAPANDTAGRADRARRALSVTCSAARILALAVDPNSDLRLPAVTRLLDRHYPGATVLPLLRDYDNFRRHGAHDLDRAERFADQAPCAIADLIDRYRTPAATVG